MKMRKLSCLLSIASLFACATSAYAASGPRAISYKEASAFERSLLARPVVPPVPPVDLYVQPANKTEPCKLPTTQSQLDRPNFHAYWDGECQNGFAFGLGRDFAISDTHHVEEITIHDGKGGNWSAPRVSYDFIIHMVTYSVGGLNYPSGALLAERMEIPVNGFSAFQTLSVADEQGNHYLIQSSAFNPVRRFLFLQNYDAMMFRFFDDSAAPMVNKSPLISFVEIVDEKTNTKGGVIVAQYANGTVKQFKLVNGDAELVRLPTAYTRHLQEKYQEIVTETANASATLQPAQQIEREYLYKACNGKSSVPGLDQADFMKICTWRDQFKEPYALASANYQRQLESLLQKADNAEQQQQIQQQIAIQQYLVQQQRNQPAWNDPGPAEGQPQQQTQVELSTAPGANKVICDTVGTITICRPFTPPPRLD